MKQPTAQKTFHRKRTLLILALLALVGAYLHGFSQRANDVLPKLQASFPQGTVFAKVSTKPLVFEARAKAQGAPLQYVGVEQGHGYGGPLHVATVIEPAGTVARVIVIDNKETPSWFRMVLENGFFKQFSERRVSEPFVVGEDIDAVSRATVSSRAFAEAIRAGSHSVGKKYLGVNIPKRETEWNFGRNEIILLILYGVILLGALRNVPKLRYLTLLAGLVFIGFYMRSPISISHFSALLLGYLKPIKEELFWWLLVAGALLSAFVLGKNLYCSWLCPFGATQELVAKLGGISVKLNKKVIRYAKYSSYFLTWLSLMVIFITSNGPLGSYEPFAALFGYQGVGAQWFILPLVILGSFVLPKFWCRFFCPAGVVLNLTVKGRRNLIGLFGGTKRQAPSSLALSKSVEVDCPKKAA